MTSHGIAVSFLIMPTPENQPTNLFLPLPTDLEQEGIDVLVQHRNVRIERIISKGHVTPADAWYDQEEHEWVIVLEGAGTLVFEDGREISLKRGDSINIPAHTKHKVSWTDPDRPTVWLAIHYS